MKLIDFDVNITEMMELSSEKIEESFELLIDKSNNNIHGRLSIHNTHTIEFMKNIGANDHILNILKNGLLLPLTSDPTPYYEKNNASAKEHREFLNNKIKSWEQAGYFCRVPIQPLVTSPITVSSKLDLSTGQG